MATVCQTSPLSASLQHQLHGYICALENPYLTTKPSPQQRLNTQLYGEARGNFGLKRAYEGRRMEEYRKAKAEFIARHLGLRSPAAPSALHPPALDCTPLDRPADQ